MTDRIAEKWLSSAPATSQPDQPGMVIKPVRWMPGGGHPTRPVWSWGDEILSPVVEVQWAEGRRYKGEIAKYYWRYVFFYCDPKDLDPPTIETGGAD